MILHWLQNLHAIRLVHVIPIPVQSKAYKISKAQSEIKAYIVQQNLLKKNISQSKNIKDLQYFGKR